MTLNTSLTKIAKKNQPTLVARYSSSNRSSGRKKRQTQFFGSPLKYSVKNVEDKSGEEKLQTIPISPGEIPPSSGNTPSPPPTRKLRRLMFAVLKPEKVQEKKIL